MRFDENLRQFVYEYEGIIFAWDEEPEKDFSDTVKKLAAGYYERLDDIVRHIAPDLKEMYGVTDHWLRSKKKQQLIIRFPMTFL